MPTETTDPKPQLDTSEAAIRDLSKTPEKLAKLATKQLTIAQEAAAEPERIERLTKMVEKDRDKLLADCDPEDRKQIAELGSLNAQLQVLPLRMERAKKQIEAEGAKLAALGAALHGVIKQLAEDECAAYLATIEERLKPYAPAIPSESEPHLRFPARAIAERCPIFHHIRARALDSVPEPLSIVENPSLLHNDPVQTIPRVIEFTKNRILVLEDYYSSRKSFVSGRFAGAPKL